MPWLDLLSDDRLDPPVVFAPVLDERLDGSVEVVGQFTAVGGDVAVLAFRWTLCCGCDRGYLKGQT